MANRCILQIALLLCSSITALSINYNLLVVQQRSCNLACQKLLRELSGTIQNCLKDRMDFEFPEEIIEPQLFQKEDALLVIRQMLQQIFEIFRRNVSSTGWNETIIENFYMELIWQSDHLETAVEEITEEENFTWPDKTMRPLRNYYLRIRKYLKAKLYSSCAWTIVQTEIIKNFSFLNRLTYYLEN